MSTTTTSYYNNNYKARRSEHSDTTKYTTSFIMAYNYYNNYRTRRYEETDMGNLLLPLQQQTNIAGYYCWVYNVNNNYTLPS